MNIINTQYTGHGIYCIENKVNSNKYIGSAVNIKDRLRHIWRYSN